MLARLLWNPIGALIVGLLALALGVNIATGTDVSCKTKTAAMAEGITCIDRSGNTLNYADWQANQRQAATVAFALGGVVLVGDAIVLVVRRRRRAAAVV